MADINSVVLVGRLTKDAELKYTSGGMAISSFSLAVGRNRKTANEWEKETSFFNVSLFGKQAESLSHYLHKGKLVGVAGYLKQRKWQGQDGQQHSAVDVCAEDIQLLGSKEDGANNQQPQYAPSQQPSYQQPQYAPSQQPSYQQPSQQSLFDEQPPF